MLGYEHTQVQTVLYYDTSHIVCKSSGFLLTDSYVLVYLRAVELLLSVVRDACMLTDCIAMACRLSQIVPIVSQLRALNDRLSLFFSVFVACFAIASAVFQSLSLLLKRLFDTC